MDSVTESKCWTLLIDDDRAFRRALEKLLTDARCRYVTVPSKEEALEWLKAHPEPTLVLIDGRLPGISNVEFAKKVKEIRPQIKTKLVGFSSFSSESVFAQEMARDLGHFVEKPLNADQLLEVIDKLTADLMEAIRP